MTLRLSKAICCCHQIYTSGKGQSQQWLKRESWTVWHQVYITCTLTVKQEYCLRLWPSSPIMTMETYIWFRKSWTRFGCDRVCVGDRDSYDSNKFIFLWFPCIYWSNHEIMLTIVFTDPQQNHRKHNKSVCYNYRDALTLICVCLYKITIEYRYKVIQYNNITQFSIQHYVDKSRMYISVWNHHYHPIYMGGGGYFLRVR